MSSYLLLTTLLWPILAIYTARLAWRYRSLRYLQQRLGFGYGELPTDALWIHCASVGEVNTLRPLLSRLMSHYPQQQFVITTNTVTGARRVNSIDDARCRHCYLPVDSYNPVRRFLRALRPRLALIMETELWPLLYRQCRQQHIPISIVNGRLSQKTLNTNRWIKARYRDALQSVDQLLCRSRFDQQAYEDLGMAAEKIQVLGNLKFAQPLNTRVDGINELEQRAYVLAASTHNNEEYLLAEIWARIQRDHHLLVIAPRHPERAASILEQLQPLQLRVAQRSRGDALTEDTDIYLADTLGELAGFIQGAELVFMGGSLVPHGGQNLLEPAAFGKAIVVGPHMHNFAEETRLFVSKQACIQVDACAQLADRMRQLLDDAEQREQLGARALELMQQQAQVADSYLQALSRHYDSLLA